MSSDLSPDEARAFIDRLIREVLEWTDLHVAASAGDAEQVAALLRAGSDVDAKGAGGQTPLYVAAEEGHLDVMLLLVLAGAVADAEVAVAAARTGDPAVLAAVSEAGADLTAADAGGRTPLHCCVMNGSLSAVEYLLRVGADPNVRDGFSDSSPLHLAAEDDHAHIAAALLRAGADPTAVDADGETAEAIARSLGNRATLDVLTVAERRPPAA